jgi:hypothetical protein
MFQRGFFAKLADEQRKGNEVDISKFLHEKNKKKEGSAECSKNKSAKVFFLEKMLIFAVPLDFL